MQYLWIGVENVEKRKGSELKFPLLADFAIRVYSREFATIFRFLICGHQRKSAANKKSGFWGRG
jgi:hypothetical protein